MITVLSRISTVSPGSPMTRLMKSRVGSSGNLNTTTWPRWTGFFARTLSSRGSADGEYMTLLTRRWSPMRRLGSIEPVGILNACTTYVRMKRARITATTTDSRYSRATDFLKVAEASARDTVWDWAAAIGGYSSRSGRSWPSVDAQHGQECLLRNVHLDLVMSGGTGVSTPRTPCRSRRSESGARCPRHRHEARGRPSVDAQ